MPSSHLSKSLSTNKLYLCNEVKSKEGPAAEQTGLTFFELMKFAGQAVFDLITQSYPRARSILFLAGTGNNGGDSYIAASLAYQAGLKVTIATIAGTITGKDPNKPLTGDARKAADLCLSMDMDILDWQQVSMIEHDLIVDGLLGTGIRGEVSEEYANCIQQVNSARCAVISIDVPSGLNADTGQVMGHAIYANQTITMIGVKSGLVVRAGREYCGTLSLAPLKVEHAFSQIANPIGQLTHYQHITRWPKRHQNSHKGTFGKLLIIGGNQTMVGAVRLAAQSALRCGVGLVKVFCHANSVLPLLAGDPEIMVNSDVNQLANLINWADGLVLGPGLGQDDWSKKVFTTFSAFHQKSNKPLVLDADGLNLLALAKKQNSTTGLTPTVMTPHDAEAARLLLCPIEQVMTQPFRAARRLATEFNTICVLKGAGTIIDNQDTCWVSTGGNPGMASGGMGDVLSGMLGACLLQHNDTNYAIQMAINLHNEAADRAASSVGEVSLIASDIILQLPHLIKEKYD